MISWFRKIEENGIDEELNDAILYYDDQEQQAQAELICSGSAMKLMQSIPGRMQYRYNQLQDICAICEFIELERDRIFSIKYKGLLDGYSKKILTSRDAERFIHGDSDYDDICKKLSSINCCKNKFLGITKALETQNYQLSNMVKLKAAGINDFTF